MVEGVHRFPAKLEACPLRDTKPAIRAGITKPVFWSPDSRFIAFAQEGKLKKIEAKGGVPQTICDNEVVVGGLWNR